MYNIPYTCNACETDVQTPVDEMVVVVCEKNDYGHQICTCPNCNTQVHKKVAPIVVAVLIHSGVRLEITEDQTPTFIEPLSKAPPVSYDDLIDAHSAFAQLSDKDLFEQIAVTSDRYVV